MVRISASTLSGLNHSYAQESRVFVNNIYDGLLLWIEPAKRLGIVRIDDKHPNVWKMLP